jgi:hypothetical protein
MSQTIKLLTISLLLMLLSCHAWGQPNLSGNLSGTLGPGYYLVVGNCFVQAGQSLTINPGTTLMFMGHYYIMVNGVLTAQGTATDSIKFVPVALEHQYRWAGLRFEYGNVPSSLSFCRMDHTLNLFLPTAYGGAIYVNNTVLNVSHSRLTRSHAAMGGGLYATGATLTITDCEFAADSADDDGAGLYAVNSSVTITGSGFYNNRCIGQTANGGGVCLDQCYQALISHCVFTGNHSAGT